MPYHCFASFKQSPLDFFKRVQTYDDHLRLIGNRVVDFLLVLIELFFARCYGWGGTSEYRLKIGNFARTRACWPKISGRKGRHDSNHSFYQKTMLNGRSYGIKIWTNFSSVFSERELMFMFAICRRPSVCLSSVCYLSVVCHLSVTFVYPTQPIEIFGNVSAPCNTLVTWRHPGKILRRSSQGNPSVGGLNERVLEKM